MRWRSVSSMSGATPASSSSSNSSTPPNSSSARTESAESAESATAERAEETHAPPPLLAPSATDTHAALPGMAIPTSAAHQTESLMPASRFPTYPMADADAGVVPAPPSSLSSENALVHNFDLSKYKDGRYKLVPASARDQIRYTGRFLHHGPFAKRKSKVNTVQFDWPGVAFEIVVRGTNTVAIRLKGDGNYFNIFIDGAFRCILKASLNATCCEVATDLDPKSEYTVTITKRTEPQMRGALSTFKVCTFYGFIVEASADVLPCKPAPVRKIEFIGDNVTCAFGNEGKVTSSKNRFGMKGRMENVHNGYACILARMFNAEAHVLAWSGKGVHSNSADWGPNMPALWKNTIASREGLWDMSSWTPDVVVVNLGANDLFPPASLETEIVGAYALFLAEVRQYRPDAHIFCVAYDDGCMSAEDSEINRSHVSLQLQEIVKVAMSKVNKHDSRMHYAFIKIDGGLEESDYATLMHYAVNGHLKIANLLAEEIALKAKWRVESRPSTMPYPQEKSQILMPKDSSNCTIS